MLARRVITAREQYELAEPFLHLAAPAGDWEKELLDSNAGEPPVEVSPDNIVADEAAVAQALGKPESAPAAQYFHPDFKKWMDGNTDTSGSYENSAWQDYHKSPEDAGWWHNQFSYYPQHKGKQPVQNPDFVNWMSDTQGDSAWQGYHSADTEAEGYHELYEEAQAPLPPGYVVGDPSKNKNTPLLGLLQGYSKGELNFAQADKAVNAWIKHNPDIADNMIKPEGVSVLKDLIGDDGLYHDFVDLLNKDNHAKLTDNYQYDPHTGKKKAEDGGSDEDVDAIQELLKPVGTQDLADQKASAVPSHEELSKSGISDYWAKQLSEYTPDQWNKIIKSWQEMPELDPTSVAAKVLKWHNSQSSPGQTGDQAGGPGHSFANDQPLDPLADWEKDLLGIKNIPDWALDGSAVHPDVLKFLDGKGLGSLPSGTLFNPNEDDHLHALTEVSKDGWDNIKEYYQEQNNGKLPGAKSVAENAAEAFAPAGFKVKTEDEFFKDHVPESTAKTPMDYKPKNDAEWEQFFKIAEEQLGYSSDNGFSETLKDLWKNVSDSDWKLNIQGGGIGKAWKQHHDDAAKQDQGGSAATTWAFHPTLFANDMAKIFGMEGEHITSSDGGKYKDMTPELAKQEIESLLGSHIFDDDENEQMKGVYKKYFGAPTSYSAHKDLIGSPEFKDWFKSANNGTDLDDKVNQSLNEMLLDTHNDWTVGKLRQYRYWQQKQGIAPDFSEHFNAYGQKLNDSGFYNWIENQEPVQKKFYQEFPQYALGHYQEHLDSNSAFNAGQFAKEYGGLMGVSPDQINSGGKKYKDMSHEEAKAALAKSIGFAHQIDSDNKEDLQALYQKHFGGGADKSGFFHPTVEQLTSIGIPAWSADIIANQSPEKFKSNYDHVKKNLSEFKNENWGKVVEFIDNGGVSGQQSGAGVSAPTMAQIEEWKKGVGSAIENYGWHPEGNLYHTWLDQLSPAAIKHFSENAQAASDDFGKWVKSDGPSKSKDYKHPTNIPPLGDQPPIPSTYYTPTKAVKNDGSGQLDPDFEKWLWQKSDKSMSPEAFLATVKSWTPAHWQAAFDAFQGATSGKPTEVLNKLQKTLQGKGWGAGGPDYEQWINQFTPDQHQWLLDHPDEAHNNYDEWINDYDHYDNEPLGQSWTKPKGMFGGGGGSSAQGETSSTSPLTLDQWNEILPGYTLWFGHQLKNKSYEEQKEFLEQYDPGPGSEDLGQAIQEVLKTHFTGASDVPGLSSGSGPSAPPPPPPADVQFSDLLKKIEAPHTVFSHDDFDLAQRPDFQKWFTNAPEKYRMVGKEFPAIPLEDFRNGGEYGWVPELEDGEVPRQYRLLHYPEATGKGGEIKSTSGETLKLPGDFKKIHWPGHTRNPEAPKSNGRPNIEFMPKRPDVPNQLELPLAGGSSWEPEYQYPTLRRGIDIKWNRYKPGGDHPHLLSRPGEEGARHRAAAQMLDEIKELMVGLDPDEKRTVQFQKDDPKNSPFQPSLFDSSEELPEGMPKIPDSSRGYGSSPEKWMDLFAWGQKNQLTPEQMWLMAKEGKLPNAEKWGTPPLSYLIAQSKRDPKPMARRIGELLGDPEFGHDYDGSLMGIARKLKRIESDSEWDSNYTPAQQTEAAHLYDKWFGQGFLDKVLADKILDYLETGGWKPGEFNDHPTPGGLGPHWTTKGHVDFGDTQPGDWGFPVQVVAEWPGLGEDPDSKDGARGFEHEKEITKNPGTPVRVKQLRIRHPLDPDRMVDLPITPHIRHARRGMIPARKRGRTVLSHRERYARDDWDTLESPMDGGEDFSPRPVMSTDQFWQMQHRYDPSEDKFHFPPNGLNPPTDSPSRPDIRWQERDPAQPTLTDDAPRDRVAQPLFRGLSIDFNHPGSADLHRMVFGHHPQDDYLFPGDHAQSNWEHPGLANAILDNLENSGHQRDDGSIYGLGPHWTVDPTTARDFAVSESYSGLREPGGLHVPVRITGDWRGLGEDPYRSHTHENYPGEFTEEGEVTMLPGAGMNIRDVQIRHPHTKQWISLPHTPHVRHAAATPIPVRPRSAKRIVSQREWLEG